MPMSRILLIVVGLNTLLILGGAVYGYTLLQEMRGSTQASDKTPVRYFFYPIEKLVLNLADQGREHYFVIDLALQTETGVAQNDLKNIEPLVRNMVLSSLSVLGFTELRSLSIAQIQARLDLTLANEFSAKGIQMPFTGILVSKMVVQ